MATGVISFSHASATNFQFQVGDAYNEEVELVEYVTRQEARNGGIGVSFWSPAKRKWKLTVPSVPTADITNMRVFFDDSDIDYFIDEVSFDDEEGVIYTVRLTKEPFVLEVKDNRFNVTLEMKEA